jgi:hypothetical protein
MIRERDMCDEAADELLDCFDPRVDDRP